MPESVARGVLKLVGITTILIGSVMTAQSLFAWLMFPNPSMSGLGVHVTMEGMVGDVARASITMNAITILFGSLLCTLSPTLARFVAGSGRHDDAAR